VAVTLYIAEDAIPCKFKATLCLSIQEPFGMVSVESMASGTPVIAVNEGGYTETVVDGKTGFLINRDSNELLSAIVDLCSGDTKLRAFSVTSVKRAKQFSWEAHCSLLENHLLSAYTKA
jgi:glycosyltransferase involved in cell wall biosynthesis